MRCLPWPCSTSGCRCALSRSYSQLFFCLAAFSCNYVNLLLPTVVLQNLLTFVASSSGAPEMNVTWTLGLCPRSPGWVRTVAYIPREDPSS